MYPRRSRFSPEIRPGNARQQLGMTIWVCAFLASLIVMFAAFILSGNFGVRELVCAMIGSAAALVVGICCFVALPTLVRSMRDALQGPGDSRPAIGSFIMIAIAALIGTTTVVTGGGAFAEDSVLRPSEGVAAPYSTTALLLSILTTESRVASRSGRTRKTSSHSQQAPTMPSIRPVLSALSQRLSSLTSTRAAGSLRPSVRREPNAPRPRQLPIASGRP